MDNLNQLNVIVNQAVNTIHSRIKEESDLLSSISARISNAYERTTLIGANANKSTTIYSASTYPSGRRAVDKPLIEKTANSTYPVAPRRSQYNLSLKQRNIKPENTNTVQLLHSINERTKCVPNTEKFPDWIENICDCMVFDTNRDAYKSSSKHSSICVLYIRCSV